MALLSSIIQYFTEAPDAAKLLKDMDATIKHLINENKDLKSQIDGVAGDIVSSAVQVNNLVDHIDELVSKVADLTLQVNDLKTENDLLRTQLSNAFDEIDDCKTELDAHKKGIHHLRNGAFDAKNQMKGLKMSTAAVKRNNTDLHQLLNETRAAVDSIQQQLIASTTTCVDDYDSDSSCDE